MLHLQLSATDTLLGASHIFRHIDPDMITNKHKHSPPFLPRIDSFECSRLGSGDQALESNPKVVLTLSTGRTLGRTCVGSILTERNGKFTLLPKLSLVLQIIFLVIFGQFFS